MSLYLEHHGNSGPELVLLHGWGLSSDIWAPVIDRLSPHYRLTLIDIPGLGKSAATENDSVAATAEALLEIAPQKALWIGWSLGGALALQVASVAPSRVSGLLMVAASPCFIQRDGWTSAMDSEVFEAFADGVALNPAKTLSRFAMLQTQGSQSARDELKQLKRVIAGAEPAALGSTLDLLREDLRPQLRALSVPTTLLLGLHDQLVPAALADAIAELNQAIEVQLFEHSAHLPFLAEPERFDAALNALAERSAEAVL
ncbi:pimeloyl-ACP methyl ester esterase BioH [Marinobacterium lutimaris]|uniref:Pimeloyl-[acyl-carrier protein] methyl ester esterase n=1 Tax=Marinobacterium lutimaris TaxID=568106 RepID=A0A1H6CH44_9GAMM|nr:pimeloyl-ACP methyl ester esterase BioH [Marinobacterium lutimaris]SEG71686.1 carboxylesterase BioH (pimeloyl-CoA synthesis) [Marinobacterium lutimaris]